MACVLVGLVVSWPAVGVGGAIASLFGFLWARDIIAGRRAAAAGAGARAEAETAPALPEPEPRPGERFPRSKFLEASTLGLGAVIGGVVTVPAVGFAIAPSFVKQGHGDIDLGPLDAFPEQQWTIVHFELNPKEGDVTRRTAYVRYNGLFKNEPSFTIISNRCAHLGCPVQPNGLIQSNQTRDEKTSGGQVIQLTPVEGLSGFGCPCHGGAYDTEGNRTAGPPVRGLDRYQFSIRSGHLFLGKAFSVKRVSGTGATARIKSFELTGPGQHIDDWESWLYPVQPPH